MMWRVLDTTWFLPAIGLALGGLAVAGLTVDGVPRWIRWASAVLVGLATIAPVAPFLALLPWHFLAVRRGLIRRSLVPYSVTVARRRLLLHGGRRRDGQRTEFVGELGGVEASSGSCPVLRRELEITIAASERHDADDLGEVRNRTRGHVCRT